MQALPLFQYSEIGSFDFEHKYYKLRDWIKPDKLTMTNWYKNPNALYYIVKDKPKTNMKSILYRNTNIVYLFKKDIEHIDYLMWSSLSENENAIRVLENNQDLICWYSISKNSNAYDLIYDNIDKVSWTALCCNTNPKIIGILEQNISYIDWINLSANPSAIHILEQYPHKINWNALCRNPNAMHILEKNLDKINWCDLSTNPSAIPFLEKHMHMINWSYLAFNPNAMQLLEKHIEKVDWNIISLNPNIYTYDYTALKERMRDSGIASEIMANRFHPSNMDKWADWGQMDEDI